MGANHGPRKLSFIERVQISRGLDGGSLECGCSFGRYLTYAGEVLTVIDEARDCARGHTRGVVVEGLDSDRIGGSRTVQDTRPERPSRP